MSERASARGREEEVERRLEPREEEDAPADGESTDERLHRLARRRNARSDLGAAELLERLGGVLGLRVDVVVRAELEREVLLVGAARDNDGLEAHLAAELDGEVAEAAELRARRRRTRGQEELEGERAQGKRGRTP